MKPKYSEKRQNVILVQDRISRTSKRVLRNALRCRRITPWSSGVQPIPNGSVVINFGGGALPEAINRAKLGDIRVLNPPNKVAIASNKLRTFEALSKADVPCVHWTTDKKIVEQWLRKNNRVLARLSVSSSGGRGIRVLGLPSGVGGAGKAVEHVANLIPDAPLYTRYFPKTHEFRVHVVGGLGIDLVEKKLRDDLRENRPDRSTIRNHDNGWVFAHDNLSVTAPDDVAKLLSLGVSAIGAVGLDFGAADLLAVMDEGNPRRIKKVVVCEINSAPGIENTKTVAAYVQAFNDLV